jgi:hypothetical protein
MLTVRILVFVFAMSRGWAFVRLPAKTTGITLRRPRYFHTPASATRPPQVDSAPASTATSQKVLHPRPVIRLERPTRLPVSLFFSKVIPGLHSCYTFNLQARFNMDLKVKCM